MKLLLSISLALAVVVAFSAQIAAEEAQGSAHQTKAEKYLQKMDTDKDGKVSKDEWMQSYAEKFQKIDSNGDGYLSEEEMNAHQKEKWGGKKEKGAACMKGAPEATE